MPKRKKGSPRNAARSSAAQSKTSYSVQIDDDLLAELRQWPKSDRRRVGKVIQRVEEDFGRPHLHSGLGIRDLSTGGKRLHVYECRVSRPLRLVFTLEHRSVLYFHMIGTHDEVQKFLRSFR
jgi:mRNA-degrading endonuclease YafQ of YafQ-DinJ toxin-antitoxin module